MKKTLNSRLIRIENSNVERLFLFVKYGFSKLVFGGLYIPPISDTAVYQSHCETVESVYQNNLPLTSWRSTEEGLVIYCPPGYKAEIIAQCFLFLNMYQLISIPNSRNVYLDLMFSHVKDLSVMSASGFPMSSITEPIIAS